MNKNELITFLRNPNDLTESDLGELEEIIQNNPYFLNGRLLLAKGSKELKHPETRKRVTSAAVYSTDRPLFKKYLSDKLFFLSQPPEEEEIEPVVEEKKKSPVQSEPKKIEILDTPKEEAKAQPKQVEQEKNKKEEAKQEKPKSIKTNQDKPRREPRFDPSATASFRRRLDVKSDPQETAPKNTESPKPKDKPVFAGKKIDRSNRVKKKSIRDEIFNEGTPKSKESKQDVSKKPTTKETPKEVQKPIESKTSVPASKPVRKETPPVKKEENMAIPVKKVEPKKVVSSSPTRDRPKSTPIEPTPTPKPTPPQEKLAAKKVEPKKADPTPTKRVELEKEKSKPTISRTNQGLSVPEVPSGGIDAILEELKRDMENLKSSRVKFTEVQQKIEEDDAVSAAVERATKNIPGVKPEVEQNTESKPTPKTESKKEVEKKDELKLKEEVKEKLEIEQKEGASPESKEIEKKKVEEKGKADDEKKEVEAEEKEEVVANKKEEATPVPEPKPEIKDKVEVDTKDNIKESKSTKEKEPAKAEIKVDVDSTSKAQSKVMPKAKKVTPKKKKAVAKTEAQPKKAATAKTSTKKKTSKAKSAKTKSTKKEEKKEDDKSGKQKADQSSIIDKFIAETPSIKYQKKGEPVENSDLSDQSTEWNKELASEYLAEIYLHQGNKKRAIEIYKALSLKFPNKKSYFADLISKTK